MPIILEYKSIRNQTNWFLIISVFLSIIQCNNSFLVQNIDSLIQF